MSIVITTHKKIEEEYIKRNEKRSAREWETIKLNEELRESNDKLQDENKALSEQCKRLHELLISNIEKH